MTRAAFPMFPGTSAAGFLGSRPSRIFRNFPVSSRSLGNCFFKEEVDPVAAEIQAPPSTKASLAKRVLSPPLSATLATSAIPAAADRMGVSAPNAVVEKRLPR